MSDKEFSKEYEEIAKACSYILGHDKIAENSKIYLNSRLSVDSQKDWQFGYFPNNNQLEYLTSLIGKDILEKTGLIYKRYINGVFKDYGHFCEHNLIIPFRDCHGDIISFIGRNILPEEEQKELKIQKYKYNSGIIKDFYLFGLNKAENKIKKKNLGIVVEGPFDCISLHEHGILNSVAVGCANLSRYQLFKLLRCTKNLLLMYDNDTAGNRAKIRIKKKYKDYVNLMTILPPKGHKDIDEFLRTNRNEDYRKKVVSKLKHFGD